MESLSDADRIAGNTQVLAEVEAQIASLEQMFAGLESLGNEGIGFAARSTNSECGRDGNARGDDVERICHGLEAIEIRARRGVQAARLTSTQDKLKEQTANLSIQGENVRRAFARIVAQLWLSRQARVTATLNDLFGGPIRLQTGRVELEELTRHMSLMKQLKDVDNRLLHPHGDKEQETAALQRARTWLAEITDLVTNEPWLMPKSIPVKRQPIEQPRDLAAA